MELKNKDKLKGLLTRLDKLENSLPQGETLSLVEKIINEKYSDITSKVKDDSSLQALEAINSKLDKFKQDFNLKPIIGEIDQIRSEITQVHD